jgi:hypothetical protein
MYHREDPELDKSASWIIKQLLYQLTNKGNTFVLTVSIPVSLLHKSWQQRTLVLHGQ